MLVCEVGKMQKSVEDIAAQTDRTLWEVRNIIRCVSDALWDRRFAGAPVYIHIYHMLHSLDRWYINPCGPYTEPSFHVPGLNDLDAGQWPYLSREQIDAYCALVSEKIGAYARTLTDEALREKPEGCAHTRLELIVGQLRHLYAHLGMLMGWIIAFDGRWPLTVGLERPIPEDDGAARFDE